MEKDAIELATFALNEYTVESQMANHIKREFDKKYRYVSSRLAAPMSLAFSPFHLLPFFFFSIKRY